MEKRWEEDEAKVESDVKGGNMVETRSMGWKRSGKEVETRWNPMYKVAIWWKHITWG